MEKPGLLLSFPIKRQNLMLRCW